MEQKNILRKQDLKGENMNLTKENVQRIIRNCLFTEEEVEDKSLVDRAIFADGIRACLGFHPERMRDARKNIRSMLMETPDGFHKAVGDGASFLSLCETKEGVLWGEHRDMEALCILAIASGLGKWCAPKEMWPSLPGGMPYIVFDLSVEELISRSSPGITQSRS